MKDKESDQHPPLFSSHFERIQRRLEAEGKAAQSFHHGLNRGLIREAFIREFLSENISEFWGVGTGEIFGRESRDREARNQVDVVIHNKRYPKLPLAAGIDLFFMETVSSFIEIKSRLTKDDVKQAAVAAKRIKDLTNFEPQQFNPTGMVKNPRPYAFIFAYEGPAKIETVIRWMRDISAEGDYGLDRLGKPGTRFIAAGPRPAAQRGFCKRRVVVEHRLARLVQLGIPHQNQVPEDRQFPAGFLGACNPEDRQFFDHQFIDGIFVLGKGFAVVDALPFESQVARAIQMGLEVLPSEIWIHGSERELEILWILISTLNEKLLWSNFEMERYLGRVQFRLGV